MSSLLDEAIVDAKALKEAALKNAENAVLEKYAGEVRGAVNSLLEQEDLGLGDATTGLGLDTALTDQDPGLGMDTDSSSPAPSAKFVDDVPYAFQNEDLDRPGPDEIIEINFDELKERIAEEEASGVSADPSEMFESEEVAEELAEGAPSDIYMEPGAGEEEDVVATGSDESAAAVKQGDETMKKMGVDLDEDLELTEELIADLVEELVVDMSPRPQGWSSVSSAENSVQQANNNAMAKAQAAHLEEEEIEEEVATAPDVVSDAELYEAKISHITESNKELRALLLESKYQLTQLNLDNAKLVYQNKALNSTSLNERQKNQIAEAVQSANSVEEAAMIYETIQNAVGASADPRVRPQTLREAVQRPSSLLINSKKNNEATKDPNMDRMLRLAGLNK